MDGKGITFFSNAQIFFAISDKNQLFFKQGAAESSSRLVSTSTHYHIKHHHQDETDGKADGAEIGVLTAGGFGYQLLNHDIEHGSCGKGEHLREDGHE